MKRYLQITLVLGVLVVLVLFKQVKGGNTLQALGSNQTQNLNFSPPSASGQSSTVSYKDGTYTGSAQDAYYGIVQVQAVISGGKITDVVFLQYPSDNRTSQYINSQAMPMLKQEALVAQSASVSGVSGASATSPAFQQSLADALTSATK
jgi:uncharacterized protein with FMN-binding domain